MSTMRLPVFHLRCVHQLLYPGIPVMASGKMKRVCNRTALLRRLCGRMSAGGGEVRKLVLIRLEKSEEKRNSLRDYGDWHLTGILLNVFMQFAVKCRPFLVSFFKALFPVFRCKVIHASLISILRTPSKIRLYDSPRYVSAISCRTQECIA